MLQQQEIKLAPIYMKGIVAIYAWLRSFAKAYAYVAVTIYAFKTTCEIINVDAVFLTCRGPGCSIFPRKTCLIHLIKEAKFLKHPCRGGYQRLTYMRTRE